MRLILIIILLGLIFVAVAYPYHLCGLMDWFSSLFSWLPLPYTLCPGYWS